jgi:hypothetical protein
MTTLRRAVAGHVSKFLSTVGERQIRVIASDATPDRMGDVLEPGGCQLDDFRRNPIMLAQHNGDQPIGSWPSIQVNSGRLEALGNSHRRELASLLTNIADLLRREYFAPFRSDSCRSPMSHYGAADYGSPNGTLLS